MSQQSVYDLLKKKDMTRDEIMKELGICQTAVNRNLRILKRTGFIQVKRTIKVPKTSNRMHTHKDSISYSIVHSYKTINVYGIKGDID